MLYFLAWSFKLRIDTPLRTPYMGKPVLNSGLMVVHPRQRVTGKQSNDVEDWIAKQMEATRIICRLGCPTRGICRFLPQAHLNFGMLMGVMAYG